jgi:predicted ATP-dependent endonuclease of OLD family
MPIQFPSAEISVRDHGFASGVERVGHGLQRAVIITILEFLARERFRMPEQAQQEFDDPASDIIIAIEEPEIYQHPTKQRHISKVLAELAASFSRHTGIRLQIILATHSPLFVHLPHFNEVRIARRHSDAPHNVIISKLTLADCSAGLAQLHAPARNPLGDNAFAAKLHIFNSEVSEGFFARKVVLVEGISDKAILEASYKLKNRSPLAEGICIVDVGGKKKLDKPAYIFHALSIPTYVIVDNDRSSTEPAKQQREIEYNHFLQRVCGVEVAELSSWPVGVHSRWAAWDGNLEKYLISRCGAAAYATAKQNAMARFEVDGDDCVKSPEIASAMLEQFYRDGVTFDELDQIIATIDAVTL